MLDKINGKKEYTIVPANEGTAYEGLRALWSEVFGDPLLYIDAFYDSFGGDINGYAVVDETGDVCSALTCYLCGTYEDRPVYVSYAICTREDMRGQGLAAMLTEHVRDEVTAAGGISIVSPAEPGLEEFYARLGYEPHFFAAERAVMAPGLDDEEYEECDEFDIEIEGGGSGAFEPAFDMQRVSPEVYNMYREAFLAGQPHVELSDSMLGLIEKESEGGRGLYAINRGDAVCVIGESGAGTVVMTELVLNPILEELSLDIDTEIAAMTAAHFGAFETVFRTPGAGRCQSMIAGLPERSGEGDETEEEYGPALWLPYFGFPVD